jgi:hypothetical protein
VGVALFISGIGFIIAAARTVRTAVPVDAPITITITTAGFYTISHEFRTGALVKNKMFQ